MALGPQKVQVRRTATPNNPPVGLAPGELSVEMADPIRLWVGVPPEIHPDQRRMLSVPQIVTGDAPPVPEYNQLWWESDTGILWLWYFDGDTSQWVQVSSSGGLVGEIPGTGGPGAAGGITFTPGGNLQADDVQEALMELDTEKVAKAGDAMTGFLFLPGDPTNALHAATKQYVDARVGGITEAPTDGQTYGRSNATWLAIGTGGGGASDALNVTFTPTGGIAATDVQAAISEVDAEKVAKAGDTMTGNLSIVKAGPKVVLDRSDLGQGATIESRSQGGLRWMLELGWDSETGVPLIGSNFRIRRMDNAGGNLGAVLEISRQTGLGIVFGNPTAPLGIATKQYVDASVADAAANSGMQLNGAFEVSQERGAASVALTPAGVNVCDVFRAGCGTGWTISASQGAGAIGQANLKNFLLLTASNTVAVAAGDINHVYTVIEGSRVARLMLGTAQARPFTIAFWVMANMPGTYSVSIRNGDATRSYIANYTINAALTLEYKVITIPGDTAGTWNKDTGAGLNILFPFTCGTQFRTPTANAWLAGNFIASDAATGNAFSAANNSVWLANIMVLPGIYAPPSTTQIIAARSVDTELPLVKRLYEVGGAGWVGAFSSQTAIQVNGRYVTKRALPTLSILPTGDYYIEQTNIGNASGTNASLVIVNSNLGLNGARVSLSHAATSAVPTYGDVGALLSDSLVFSARL